MQCFIFFSASTLDGRCNFHLPRTIFFHYSVVCKIGEIPTTDNEAFIGFYISVESVSGVNVWQFIFW
jgi:hypothetical protein